MIKNLFLGAFLGSFTKEIGEEEAKK